MFNSVLKIHSWAPSYKQNSSTWRRIRNLRWNKQVGLAGKKDELLERCIDGHEHGRLGACPICIDGKLKLNTEKENITCSGYYDEVNAVRNPCFYTCAISEAPRLHPWHTSSPSDAEQEEMEVQASGAGKKKNEDVLLTLLPIVKKIEWDLSSPQAIKNVNVALLSACRESGRVNLPNDESNAKIEIGRVLLSNKDKSCEEVCHMILEQFGTKMTGEEVQKKQQSMSSQCACPANGPIYEAMLELGTVRASFVSPCVWFQQKVSWW